MIWLKNVAECNLWEKMCPNCLFIIPEDIYRAELSHGEKNSFVQSIRGSPRKLSYVKKLRESLFD